MRKLPWTIVSVVVAVSGLNLFFVGCGSDETATVPDSDAGDETASSSGASSGASSSGTSGASSSGSSGTTDSGQDGDLVDGQGCALVGQNCTAATAATCCTKVCNVPAGQTQGQCAVTTDGGAACTKSGDTCTAGTQCCTGSCVGGMCSATACLPDNPATACTNDNQCCSGRCGATGTGPNCIALAGGTGCQTEGNACTKNSDCCSQQCGANGKCVNVSFCAQTNDVCSADYECCGGICSKTGGATLGRCAIIGGANCTPAGTVCSGIGCDHNCCSLSCGPFGTTGVNICQPPSGCKPQDELCQKSEDCCGGPGQLQGQKPNHTGFNDPPLKCEIQGNNSFGRCEGDQCLRPGDVCKPKTGSCGGTSNNCCESLLPDGGLTPSGFCNSTPEACCSRDALGIPRCRGVNFLCGDGGAVAPGSTCTTSADCCGKPCVNLKCEGTCVAKGGMCTVTADCCSPEQCVIPTGSTTGICGGVIGTDGGVNPPDATLPPDAGATDAATCALYGQSCTVNANCCNGVPCVGGTCRFN